MARRYRSSSPPPSSPFNYTSLAILAGVFVLGIGIGIAFSSTANFSPQNVASREVIDRSAPNPELCIQYGASAIAADLRIFLTLNPFNVFVSQPRMQPGCVLRTNTWSILEQRKLLDPEEVRDCKNRMNTFGFTGNLGESPQIDCVYQNDRMGNLFLKDRGGGLPAETERF